MTVVMLASGLLLAGCKKDDKETPSDEIPGTFTDNRDGKLYKWVKIGNQVWMAENLAFKATTGYWAYNNDENNVALYGYLYDWNTAMIAAPDGWQFAKRG